MGITDMFSLAFVSLYSVIYINMFIYSDKQESDLKIKSNRLTATNDFWNLYSQDQLREVKKKKTNLKTLALLLQAEVVPFASIETFANGNTRCSVLYPMYRLSRHLKKNKNEQKNEDRWIMCFIRICVISSINSSQYCGDYGYCLKRIPWILRNCSFDKCQM